MAERVVHLFKPVEIEKQQRDASQARLGNLNGIAQAFAE